MQPLKKGKVVMPWLINTAQFANFRKSQKNLIVFDASWFLPNEGRHAKEEFIDKHIAGAQFFDINLFNDPTTNLPNIVTTDEKLISEQLGMLGIRNDYKIIFYDNSPQHSACRALWMMKLFGHNPQQLYILDGGLSAWEKAGGKMESGETSISPKQYLAAFQPEFLCSLKEMKRNLTHPDAQVIDARHPVRFAGGPEPRPNTRQGHIPNSFSLPYFTLFDKEGHFIPIEKIRKQFFDMGIDIHSRIVTTCGSAITAPIINFILDLMQHHSHAVYNGSWSEWGNEKLYPGEISLDERPIETCLEEP